MRLRAIRAHLARRTASVWGVVKRGGRAAGRAVVGYADDLLIIAGLGVAVLATFRLGVTAGLYALGAALVILGAVLARQPPKGR